MGNQNVKSNVQMSASNSDCLLLTPEVNRDDLKSSPLHFF